VGAAYAESKKPNILVIWGDDIGQDNISAYHRGLMGGRTPNIDRIANEGALFTDHYGQQSCTAGRAAFMLGQNPFRTGLLTIGMPGAKHGVRKGVPRRNPGTRLACSHLVRAGGKTKKHGNYREA
jgi:arylsulfatase